MAYKDLMDFIATLEKNNQLVRIKKEVDFFLEIAEINNRVVSEYGPALLFENIKGYKMPVLINALGTYERLALAFEVNHIEDIANNIREVFKGEPPATFWQKIKKLSQLRKFAHIAPRMVSGAPCQEVVNTENPSLAAIPVLHFWPGDGGRFITLPMVFTKNPETGSRNCGMYRLQVHDKRTLGMHWHIHKHAAHHYRLAEEKNQPLEVAIAIGGDPATYFASGAPLPDEVDEMLLAGFLRNKPVELVKCKTVDLEVPANADIILEGVCLPGEKHLEGPFGDHTGYYSPAEDYPVFHLKAITMRKNPVYVTTMTGKPPREDCYMGQALVKIFRPLLQMTLPEITDMNLPQEGVFHNIAIVAIDKHYPGHARKVMSALWGLGQMMFTKIIIVVDKEVNVHDLSEVIWRVGNSIDPKNDVMFTEGPVDALDHASRTPIIGSKMGIDATRKWPEEGHTRKWPDLAEMDKGTIRMVTRQWSEYGIDLKKKI